VSPPCSADRDAEGSASFSGNRTPPRAAGVSPPWVSEPHMQVQCDVFRRPEFVCGMHSTGGLRPPLLSLIRRASAGRMTILAMNKRTPSRAANVRPPWSAGRDAEGSASFSGNRTPSRAAGVSPPWVGRHVYADTRAIARKTAGSLWADHRCHRVQRYHGGLTPPARGCTTFVRCEKRHSHCTNAPSQERRASARRGSQNRICKCNAMNFRVSNSYAECMLRGAYASRSWSGVRALGELWVFHLQIRPEHRCVRERAQHTCVFQLQTRYVHHSWRTPSAPGCVCGRCCRCAILADEKDAFPRGAYAPRSCRWYNEHPQEERRFLRCTIARSQERRASARRGQRIVMPKEVRVLAAIEHRQERRSPARRGFTNRICKCNAMNFGASSSRAECIPRGTYAPRSWLHARHIACDMRFRFATADVSHGWLTPAAPGRECERWANDAYSSCKFDRNIAAFGNAPSTHAYSSCGFDAFTTAGARHPLLAACADAVADVRFWPTKKMLFHGGLTPPALVADTTSIRRKNDDSCDEQTHAVKSGERPPAMVSGS
jgi:hypothetical protein